MLGEDILKFLFLKIIDTISFAYPLTDRSVLHYWLYLFYDFTIIHDVDKINTVSINRVNVEKRKETGDNAEAGMAQAVQK